jgi:hypothetical protein
MMIGGLARARDALISTSAKSSDTYTLFMAMKMGKPGAPNALRTQELLSGDTAGNKS